MGIRKQKFHPNRPKGKTYCSTNICSDPDIMAEVVEKHINLGKI